MDQVLFLDIVVNCNFQREYTILPNHHASVFGNAMEDQVLSNGVEELVNVQSPNMYSVPRSLFATAVGNKTKPLQAQRGRTELSNMMPVYSMVQRYPGIRFRMASLRVGQASCASAVHRQ